LVNLRVLANAFSQFSKVGGAVSTAIFVGLGIVLIITVILAPSSPPSPQRKDPREAESIAIVNRSYVMNHNPMWQNADLSNIHEFSIPENYAYEGQCKGQCWLVTRRIPFFINGETKDIEFEWLVMPSAKVADPNNTPTQMMYTRICMAGC
jgi:hypothetical protein